MGYQTATAFRSPSATASENPQRQVDGDISGAFAEHSKVGRGEIARKPLNLPFEQVPPCRSGNDALT